MNEKKWNALTEGERREYLEGLEDCPPAWIAYSLEKDWDELFSPVRMILSKEEGKKDKREKRKEQSFYPINGADDLQFSMRDLKNPVALFEFVRFAREHRNKHNTPDATWFKGELTPELEVKRESYGGTIALQLREKEEKGGLFTISTDEDHRVLWERVFWENELPWLEQVEKEKDLERLGMGIAIDYFEYGSRYASIRENNEDLLNAVREACVFYSVDYEDVISNYDLLDALRVCFFDPKKEVDPITMYLIPAFPYRSTEGEEGRMKIFIIDPNHETTPPAKMFMDLSFSSFQEKWKGWGKIYEERGREKKKEALEHLGFRVKDEDDALLTGSPNQIQMLQIRDAYEDLRMLTKGLLKIPVEGLEEKLVYDYPSWETMEKWWNRDLNEEQREVILGILARNYEKAFILHKKKAVKKMPPPSPSSSSKGNWHYLSKEQKELMRKYLERIANLFSQKAWMKKGQA